MKTLIVALLLVGSLAHAQVQAPTPTIAAASPKQDLPALPASSKYLSDHLLQRFNEPRLDDGAPNSLPLIRITAIRGKDSPVMLIWHPDQRDGTSTLRVKMLEVNEEQSSITYSRIILDRKITLSQAQTRSLKSIYTLAPIHTLPQETWQSDKMDGSVWVFEAASGKKAMLLVRMNPIDPEIASNPIPATRLAKELQLSTFALNLWVLANIDALPY